jgi:hypothetical protein
LNVFLVLVLLVALGLAAWERSCRLDRLASDVEALVRTQLGGLQKQHGERLSALEARLDQSVLDQNEAASALGRSFHQRECLLAELVGTALATHRSELDASLASVLDRPLPAPAARPQHWGLVLVGTRSDGRLVLLQAHGHSLAGETVPGHLQVPHALLAHATLLTWGPVLLKAVRIGDALFAPQPAPFHVIEAPLPAGQKIAFQMLVLD